MNEIDLAGGGVRALNAALHAASAEGGARGWRVVNPMGAHAVAVGLARPLSVEIDGHVGYYCGGMNREASLVVNGHCGTGVAENMMSGSVRVRGNASQCAGASGRGGLLVVEGDCGPRCGISMKGIDIVVGGAIGPMSAFMAQSGTLVVCGDAGDDLGDSIFEAAVYVGGAVGRLGADCVEKEMAPADRQRVGALLARAGITADADRFRRFGSARRLYRFRVDNADVY